MKYVVSRYNQDIDWLRDYTDDYVLYDRSETPIKGAIVVPNIGSDLYDKFSFIIDNYDNLPEVAVYTKANLFKYITREEFDSIKDNKTFTPILTKCHPDVICDAGMATRAGELFSYYKDGMYYELNYPSYLNNHDIKEVDWQELRRLLPENDLLRVYKNLELVKLLGLSELEYIPFAPGSNYILPKENILKHSKDFYIKLRSFLEWDRYPGEAMILERGLYNLWK